MPDPNVSTPSDQTPTTQNVTASETKDTTTPQTDTKPAENAAGTGSDTDGTAAKGPEYNWKKLQSEKEEYRKKAEAYEQAEQKRKDDELKKKGDYEKLLSERETKVTELQAEVSNLKKQGTLNKKLTDAGVQPKYSDFIISKLTDLEVDGDGNLVGVDDRLNECKTQYPEFFGTAQKPSTVGTPTTSAPSNLKKWKASDIKTMSSADYMKNEADILRSQKDSTFDYEN